MRNLSLNIAAICSLLAAVVSVVAGMLYAASGSYLLGFAIALIGTPFSIACAVVFDYVAERLRRDLIEGNSRSKKDVIDTPWENDPDHV